MLWIFECVASLAKVTQPKITHSLEFTVTYQLEEDEGPRKRTILLDLYGEKCPRTVENFYTLATRSKTPNYKNTIFHRIVKDFVLQGGDITNKNGTGQYSIYDKEFEDEIKSPNEHKKGSLSMANRGKNTNGSQFFIVTADSAFYLDDKHTVFGQVRPESFEVIDEMNNIPVNPRNDMPLREVSVIEIKDISKPKTSDSGPQKEEEIINNDVKEDKGKSKSVPDHGDSDIDSFANLTSEDLQLLFEQYQNEKKEETHAYL